MIRMGSSSSANWSLSIAMFDYQLVDCQNPQLRLSTSTSQSSRKAFFVEALRQSDHPMKITDGTLQMLKKNRDGLEIQ